MKEERIAVAGCIDVNSSGTIRIWIPPKGRPFWVRMGQRNAGPALTDAELEEYGLSPD